MIETNQSIVKSILNLYCGNISVPHLILTPETPKYEISFIKEGYQKNQSPKSGELAMKTACERCTYLKIKCIRDTKTGPCKRCIRLCECCKFERQRKRGPKTKNEYISQIKNNDFNVSSKRQKVN